MGRPLLGDTFLKGSPSIGAIGSVNMSEALVKLIAKTQNSPGADDLGNHSTAPLITQRDRQHSKTYKNKPPRYLYSITWPHLSDN